MIVGSILLIEDVRFTRAITRKMIESLVNYDIHEVASGQEALEALRIFDDINLIVADISMPGMTGLELLKEIRTDKSAAKRNIPFIIISGAITNATLSVLEKLDVSAVIAKPVHKDDLHEKLKQIIAESSTNKQAVRSIEEYRNVNINDLLKLETPETSPTYGNLDDYNDRVRFLETVPALAGVDMDALRQLAKGANILQFPENTIIEPSEIAGNRLLLIAWGEAEVLQTTRSPRRGDMEHRIDLIEAGGLLGITAFMSLPGEADHSQIRTTRSTEVMTFDFTDVENNPELKKLKDKVKLSVSRTLAQQLTQSDKAIAENLAHRLAETKIKRSAGGFVIMTACSLAIYTLTIRAMLDLDLQGKHRGIASVVMILVAFLPFIISVRTGPFKFADLGLTFKGAREAAVDAIVFSSLFLAGMIGIKYLFVTSIPAYRSHTLFELAETFVRPGNTGGIDVKFYVINIFVYALFVPVQEVVSRCGLQSFIKEFLYGSERYRTIVAILVSNIIFAAAHAHLNVGFATATFIGGLFWGWLFHRRRSIVGVTISHLMIGGSALFALGLETFLK